MGGAGGAGGAAGSATACVGTHVTTPKRLVRLTENQLVNTYGALFTPALAQTIATEQDIPPATFRAFPPLATSGVLIGDSQFSMADRMAQSAHGARRHEHGDRSRRAARTPTDATCAQNFLFSFAEKAFRRPITAEERTAIQTELFTEMTAATTATPPGNGGTIAEAIQYGVFGILSSPGFLYRTEFGDNPAADGPAQPVRNRERALVLRHRRPAGRSRSSLRPRRTSSRTR